MPIESSLAGLRQRDPRGSLIAAISAAFIAVSVALGTVDATADERVPEPAREGARSSPAEGKEGKSNWWRMPKDANPPSSRSAGPKEPCHECYPPFATGVMPLVTPRSVNRIGADLAWGFRSVGGATAWLMSYSVDGELAAIPGRFAIGFRLDTSLVAILGGGGGSDAALRSFGFGFKGTVYDDRRGNALSVVVTTTIVNSRSDGLHADVVSLGGGVFGALRLKKFHLLGIVAGTHGFAIRDGLGGVDAFQWGLQPSLRITGPHHVGLVLTGAAQVSGPADLHLVDLSAGYIHSSDGFKGALMLGFPLTNREIRASVQMHVKAGWEF